MDNIYKIAGEALKFLNVVGAVIAVVILAIFGIKWFFANSQEKAILKVNMWAYVIGAFLVFAGPQIFGWVVPVLASIYKAPIAESTTTNTSGSTSH